MFRRIATAALIGTTALLQPQVDRTVVPGQRVGIITAETSEAELRERLGDDALSSQMVPLAEGMCAPGALVFPGTPDQLELAWADSARTRPAFVRIRGEGSSWSTPRGVEIGTPLAELERIEGGPVQLYGFEWEASGGMDWPAGTAEGMSGEKERLVLRLEPDWSAAQVPGADLDTAAIFGGVTVRSDHPILRRLRVTVREMIVSWDRPYGEIECDVGSG